MTNKELENRARRLPGVESLLPMQRAMMKVQLPARVLLQAPTGSGKTLAYVLAALRVIEASKGAPQILVVAPTRELTLQIFDVMRTLALPDFKATAVYGGHSYEAEAKSLEAGTDIVVGTPGRIVDHINRRRLDLRELRALVIDEYDKSLELGFEPDMRRIVHHASRARTFILTSATVAELPPFVSEVDTTLDYTGGAAPQPKVQCYSVSSPSPDKLDTLCELLRGLAGKRLIVFVNHREAADRVYGRLRADGFGAALYHGGLDQQLRERALILFENGTCPVLVATDLAARGLDIDSVDAVVHYHLPSTPEAWTHRNGRTARMGATGEAYAIVSEHDKTIPAFMTFSSDRPSTLVPVTSDLPAPVATLYFNAGRKEKISRGDIAGFLIAKGGLEASEVGRIDVKDHCAYAAVPAAKAGAVVKAVAPHKIKNTRVRVTPVE